MSTVIENAKIDSVFIGREDHGILTMFVHVSGATWSCGFGGYALDSYDHGAEKRIGSPMLSNAVLGLLDVFGLHDIAQLSGRPCRAEIQGLGGSVTRLGHFLEDRWFSFEELAKSEKAKRTA